MMTISYIFNKIFEIHNKTIEEKYNINNKTPNKGN